MILLNFSHPLTKFQLAKIKELAGIQTIDVRDVSQQLDIDAPFAEQVHKIVNSIDLSPYEWQTSIFLINPPAYSPFATILVAELHGRMGYFPAIIRMQPVVNSTPRQFEISEIVNLQATRDRSRTRRI